MKIRRDYQLTIRMGNKSRVFTYRQATALDTIKFMEEIKSDDFNLILWLFSFLNDVCRSKRPFFSRKNISYKQYIKYVVDFEKIFAVVQKTYFFGAFTKPGEVSDEEQEESMPFDAYLTLLAEKLNIDPLSLLERYTFEQIGELGKGIVYVINMQTEEGKKKNAKMKLEEKMRNVDRNQIAMELEKLEAWKKKNLDARGTEIEQKPQDAIITH